MERNLDGLTARHHDVVIIGGGIFGACIAWDAALRGLDVALLEKEDFGHATSANSFKMVHGGIRYIQHGDIPRIRESSAERRALLKIAPHLVEPLPIVIPTYGHGMKGKELLAAGMWLYDLITMDRNRGLTDPSRRIPAGKLLSRKQTLELFPGLPSRGLTGGALFHDAQMYNPTRLVLAFLEGAARQGAQVANYAAVEGFIRRGSRIEGVRVRDRLTDSALTVRGGVVVNAAGPWAASLLPSGVESPPTTFSRDACFVVPRRLAGTHALAVLGRTHDPDALLSRKARHLFLVPWRDATLVGVWHVVHEGPPDAIEVRPEELEGFIQEINSAYPAADLDVEEVTLANAGLVLFGDHQVSEQHLSYGKRSLVIDHGKRGDGEGLVSVIGVRYTTARSVAVKAVDIVERRLRGRRTKSRTATTPLPGGDIETLHGLRGIAAGRVGGDFPADMIERIIRNYGSDFERVLDQDPTLRRVRSSEYLRAEILHSVKDEMACTLSDVVFRRTDMATAAPPPTPVLHEVADIMAEVAGWTGERRAAELDAVLERFRWPSRPLAPSLPEHLTTGSATP